MADYSIAVVDDNAELLADLVEFLRLRGFAAQGFAEGEALLQALPQQHFDLILLDILLPGPSGYEIAARIRSASAHYARVGIIMLTALSSDQDHVQGLTSGADMFLSKSSSLAVIEASCRNLLQRLPTAPAPSGATALSTPSWCLYSQQWFVESPNHERLPLTHTEVLLLNALMSAPGAAITRTDLLARLDKQDSLSNLRNLDNTVSRLKRKFQDNFGSELPIRPSYGKGYTFTDACVITPCP
jgi:DNA-binding response OmpR family regulator